MGKILVACFSAAGNTRHVAEVIAGEFVELGHSPEFLDLCAAWDGNGNAEKARGLKKGDCLWIGSPIYALHALPAVMDFISGIPDGTGAFAVPFVTYGGVNSGTGLPEMGRALSQKGFEVLGGAKIMAVHTTMWCYDNPLGEGRPNSDDDQRIKAFVHEIQQKMANRDNGALFEIEGLDYQPLEDRESAQHLNLRLLMEQMGPPLFNEELCSQCGTCEQNCPTANITLNPYPEFGDKCILCCNCIRLCEWNAITHKAFGMLEEHLRSRSAKAGEKHETEVFI